MLQPSKASERLSTLMGYLETDPNNLTLISETIICAMEDGDTDIVQKLIDHHKTLAPFTDEQLDEVAKTGLTHGQHAYARGIFERLAKTYPEREEIRYNLAYASAMSGDSDMALSLITPSMAQAIAPAARLRIQLMHADGQFDNAMMEARQLIEIHPTDRGLMAAVSVLALDVEDEALALRCAQAAPDHPDAMTTLGTFALDSEDPSQARPLFDQAITANPKGARSWIGRGLSELMTGNADAASKDLDEGAKLFGDHIGSWIAAGWAHCIKGDAPASRSRFNIAMEIDPNFAESHGSLAVLDVLEGNTDEARKRTLTALKLDRECFSAALAMTMLQASDGHKDRADQIFRAALSTPIGDQGRTIAQSLTRLGLKL